MTIAAVLHSRLDVVHFIAGSTGYPIEVDLHTFNHHLLMVDQNEGFRLAVTFDYNEAMSHARAAANQLVAA